MKKVMLLMSFVLLACSSNTEEIEEYSIYGENKGGVYFSAFIESSLSTGEIIENKRKVHTYIWDAENRDFNMSKSGQSDVILGYLFDDVSGKSIKTNMIYFDDNSFYELLPEGRYFIYVTTGNTIPRFAYSYRYFEVEYKKDIKLKKVFSQDTHGITEYPW